MTVQLIHVLLSCARQGYRDKKRADAWAQRLTFGAVTLVLVAPMLLTAWLGGAGGGNARR
jgi:uncharacterized BrkB/YihY/UPF0761 family membrane protein